MTAAEQIALYRSRHTIKPRAIGGRELDPILVCAVDQIAIVPVWSRRGRPIGYRHAPAEIRTLSRAAIAGTWP